MFQKDLILFGATVYCQMKGSLLYELSQNGQTFQILVFNIQFWLARYTVWINEVRAAPI